MRHNFKQNIMKTWIARNSGRSKINIALKQTSFEKNVLSENQQAFSKNTFQIRSGNFIQYISQVFNSRQKII